MRLALAGLALVASLGCQAEPLPGPDRCGGDCGEHAVCDETYGTCFCELGTLGDPRAACVPHGDMCGEAEARLGHSVCEHEILDDATWSRLSIGHANHPALARGAKYLLPAVPEATLAPVLADTNWYRTHYCIMAEGFEPLFPGLQYQGYRDLVFQRATRQYYGGTVSELSTPTADGHRFVFSVEFLDEPGEQLGEQEIHGVYRELAERFSPGELAYFPDSDLHRAAAESWEDPPFPIAYLDEGPGPQYEAYTPGLAYGTVRSFTNEELLAAGPAPFGWQDIIVVDAPPLSLEGVMAGAITEARQDVLTHLNVLSSIRGTPNVHVANALDVLAPFEGRLVRFEALATEYSVREATLEEAQAHWAATRPHAEVQAPPDLEFAELSSLDDVPVGTADERNQAVSRFGSKATGLAVLRSITPPEHVATGLGIPMRAYFDFMSANTWVAPIGDGTEVRSYGDTIDAWLEEEAFRLDPQLRSDRLAALRDEMVEHGVVDPALLAELRTRIGQVLGDEAVMVRLRSSSNAEDSLAFNGAGLYESKSGCALDAPDDPFSACDPTGRARPLDHSLKEVWASLWSFGAFEERDFYQIDHREVGMGVLVNPRFEGERANGVAFTGNPSDLDDPRYTINVQLGEVPVVSSTPGVVAELDRVLLDDDGQVVQIDRELGSTLLPEGERVLDDARLAELANLLWNIEAVYPVDAIPPEGTAVLLDVELKITADDALVLKQIRPFSARPYAPLDELCR